MHIVAIDQQERVLKYRHDHILKISFQGEKDRAKVFALDGPARLVIDMEQAKLDSALREIQVGNRLIKMIRFGQFSKDIVRIVYDLERYLETDQLELRWQENCLEIAFDLLMVDLFDHQEKIKRELLLREYVEGVVAAEMPAEFSLESLVAQGIVARTYALRRMRIFGGKGYERDYDLTSDSKIHQAWWSTAERMARFGEKYPVYQEKLRKVARLCGNQYITFEGELIDAVYHSTCGGQTVSARDVWGSSVPYLTPVVCEYCKNSPHYHNSSDASRVFQVKPETGRPKSIVLADKEYSATEFRKEFGLPSSWVVGLGIETRGFGHGVGLCQWGAEGQAQVGRGHRDIIYHYYPGVRIEGGGEVPVVSALVVVDPGHGGRDPGAMGIRLKEKDINLAVALRLQRVLLDAGVFVVLTRDDDRWISLEERAALANQMKARIFVSIHCNGAASPLAQGTETYHFPTSLEGKKLAESIHSRLVSLLGRRDRGIKTANFAVLRETTMPAVLVELAFITNREEEELLGTDIFQQRAALAIREGISRYLKP